MADSANKYPENVPGKFYVDDQCIDCDLCRETAPANFKRNDDGGHSYVYKQPETPDEEGLCKEAMEGCPVEAIGSDGNGAYVAAVCDRRIQWECPSHASVTCVSLHFRRLRSRKGRRDWPPAFNRPFPE